MNIYTVGDSHCWHAWLKVPGVVTMTRGPMTMYRFGQSKPIVLDEVPDGSIVIFCWGEIDCRCHVNKYQPWKDTIENLVKSYIEAIRHNVEDHGHIKKTFIFNVVPPPRKGNTPENPGFPFLGTDEERLSYVKYMNELLRKGEYPLIDVYDKYADVEGFLKKELSDGHVHIADEKPLKEFIDERISRI